MIIGQAFKMFMIDKQVANLTRFTLADYRNMVGMFVEWVGLSKEVVCLGDDMLIKKYIMHLQNREITGQTIYTYIKHIKVFYNYLFNKGIIQNNPVADLRIKREKKLPEILNQDEIDRLLSIDNVRDRTIVLLVLDTGIRKQEISRLEVSDIKKDMIYIRSGKGRKDRFVPINSMTYDALQTYIDTRDAHTDIVFQTVKGTPLTYTGIRQVFRRLKYKTNILRLSPHLLRHTYATYFIERGGDIKMLQVLLGHSETKTTEIYIHLANVIHVNKYSKFSIINDYTQ